jgi:hypothetical protein
VTTAASFVGAWGALGVRLTWMRAEIERAHTRIDRLEKPFFDRPRPAGPEREL